MNARHEAGGARWPATVEEMFSAGRRLLARRRLRDAGAPEVPTGPETEDADPLVRLAHHPEDTTWR